MKIFTEKINSTYSMELENNMRKYLDELKS